MNKFKRLFCCFCLLSLYLLSSIGLVAKATVLNIPNPTIQKDSKSFCLYSGQILTQDKSSDNKRIAGHYSHRSHVSHRSHYSSSY